MGRYKALEGTLTADATALTSSYVVTGGSLASQDRDQLYVLVDYTKGDETDMRMKVTFFSPKTTTADRYQESAGSTNASGVTAVSLREYTFTATGKYCVPVSLAPGMAFEVSFKATAGTPTGTFGADYRIVVLERY